MGMLYIIFIYNDDTNLAAAPSSGVVEKQGPEVLLERGDLYAAHSYSAKARGFVDAYSPCESNERAHGHCGSTTQDTHRESFALPHRLGGPRR